MKRFFLHILLIILVVVSCQAEKPSKYIPASKRKREKLATPEPGTYLKPAALTILREINRAIEKPEASKKPADWMLKVLSAPQKKLLDTLISNNGHSVPIRIYYPDRKSLRGNHPVILFLHGGGFVLGSVDEYHMLASKMARVTGQILVSVEYRLAPDFPFPAGLNDCYAVLRWLQENAISIGGDSGRISVMGDSAGGNLATVLTLKCRDENVTMPRSQVLIYPGVTFVDTLYPSRQFFGQCEKMRYVLDEEFLRSVKLHYLGTETNDRHPYLSPLEARLTPDLPPALVITAECDPIRDDGRLYAKKLSEAGIPVEHLEYSGMIHGFLSFHIILGDAVHAMKSIDRFMDGLP